MAYTNTVKVIILTVILIVIGFAIGIAWNINRAQTNQGKIQICAATRKAHTSGTDCMDQ